MKSGFGQVFFGLIALRPQAGGRRELAKTPQYSLDVSHVIVS
jgi:hypothetical protein